ncbi:hypothetical protein SLA2020_482450 [Shorea laevis]
MAPQPCPYSGAAVTFPKHATPLITFSVLGGLSFSLPFSSSPSFCSTSNGQNRSSRREWDSKSRLPYQKAQFQYPLPRMTILGPWRRSLIAFRVSRSEEDIFPHGFDTTRDDSSCTRGGRAAGATHSQGPPKGAAYHQ